MHPLIALLALDPFFSVNISIVACVNIDLEAKVTKLVLGVGIGAAGAQPAVLVFPEFPARPIFSITTALKGTELVVTNLYSFLCD